MNKLWGFCFSNLCGDIKTKMSILFVIPSKVSFVYFEEKNLDLKLSVS